MSYYHPDTIADINHLRRANALTRWRKKVQRCERLLIAAHYLIVNTHMDANPRYPLAKATNAGQLIHDIELEIGHK